MNHEIIDTQTKQIVEAYPDSRYELFREYLELRERPVGVMVFGEMGVLSGFTKFLERSLENVEVEDE